MFFVLFISPYPMAKVIIKTFFCNYLFQNIMCTANRQPIHALLCRHCGNHFRQVFWALRHIVTYTYKAHATNKSSKQRSFLGNNRYETTSAQNKKTAFTVKNERFRAVMLVLHVERIFYACYFAREFLVEFYALFHLVATIYHG